MTKHSSILTCLELILKGFFESGAPDVVPTGAFGELKIWLFESFKPFVPGVVPAGAFWELEIWFPWGADPQPSPPGCSASGAISGGVFNIDLHHLPEGLHAEIENVNFTMSFWHWPSPFTVRAARWNWKCQFYDVSLTLTLTVYRKGCTLKLKMNDLTMILKRPNHEVL